jgi:hypothetical protein
MTARKRGLVAVLVLIDVAAIFLAVYLISTSGPEPWVGANGHILQIPGREIGAPGMLEIILGAPVTANLSINYTSPTGVPGFRRLTLGAKAADFSLPRVGEGPKAHLAQLRADKPVVLIFSSFTCDLFCNRVNKVEWLYQTYRDRAEFLLVLIKEANHSVPGLEFLLKAKNTKLEERRRLVARALEIKKVTIPAALDVDRAAEKAYSAWPLRLVVVNSEGRIAFDAPFNPATGLNLYAVEQWMKDNLK